MINTYVKISPGGYQDKSQLVDIVDSDNVNGATIPVVTSSYNTADYSNTYYTGPNGQGSFNGNAYSEASYGAIKLAGSFDLQNYEPKTYTLNSSATEDKTPIFSQVYMADTVTIGGGNGTGYLQVTSLVAGDNYMSDSSRASWRNMEYSIYVDSPVATAQQKSQVYQLQSIFTMGLPKSNVSTLIPFTYNTPFTLGFRAWASPFIYDSDSLYTGNSQVYNLSGSYDYSIKLSDFSVYSDAAGLNQTNFSLTASSGTLYPVSVVASVPEIDSYAMLLAGLGVLGFVTRRKKLA